jgi:hypothetical protein
VCSSDLDHEVSICVSVISLRTSFVSSKQAFVKGLQYLPMIRKSFIKLHCPVDGLSDMLCSSFPSILCSGLRILIEATRLKPSSRMIRLHLPEAMGQSLLNFRLFEVAELFGILIQQVMGSCTDLMEPLAERYRTEIVVPSREAAFLPIAAVLPAMIRALDPSSSGHKQLAQYCDAIGSRVMSLVIFRIYAQGLQARLSRPSKFKAKSEFARKVLVVFFEANPDFDSYDIHTYLREWVTLLRCFVPFDKSLELIINLFIGRLPKFLPGFAQIAKITKEVRAKQSPDHMAVLKAALKKAKELVSAEDHKQAIERLINDGSIAEAMKLAMK